MRVRIASWAVLSLLALVTGCTSNTTPGNDDAGSGGGDSGRGADTCSGRDSGAGADVGSGTDAGAGVDSGTVVDGGAGVDAGSGTDAGGDGGTPGADAGVDSGVSDAGSDAGPLLPDGALMCSPGVECTNYGAALAASARGAAGGTPDAALANCVIQMHQADCCGAMHANGINHGSRTTLCPAECMCEAMYPRPAGCSSTTITTYTGETTTTMSEVRLRVVNPMSCSFGTCYTCETFVCRDASCASAPGIAGGCGPCP